VICVIECDIIVFDIDNNIVVSLYINTHVVFEIIQGNIDGYSYYDDRSTSWLYFFYFFLSTTKNKLE